MRVPLHITVLSRSVVQLCHTLWTVAQLVPCPWGFPTQKYEVGCQALQGIFPTQDKTPVSTLQVSHISCRLFTVWATRGGLNITGVASLSFLQRLLRPRNRTRSLTLQNEFLDQLNYQGNPVHNDLLLMPLFYPNFDIFITFLGEVFFGLILFETVLLPGSECMFLFPG